jgi:hypothetical protein
VKRVEREDAAFLRVDPEHLLGVGRIGHWKHAGGIGAHQQVGIEPQGHGVRATNRSSQWTS